jgi:hypothetical protein
MRRFLVILAGLLIALLPASALADGSSDNHGGFAMRVNGDYTVSSGDSLNALVVIRGDAVVDGSIHSGLLVIDGDATVRGSVEGDIRVINGTLTLSSGSRVKNVQLVRSELTRDPGASVTGSIDRTSRMFFSAGWVILFGFILFIGLGVALLVLATGFAMIGGRQLSEASASLGGKPGQTILAGFVTLLALPVLGALAIASIVGFWVGMGILFVLIPVLTALGYVVVGTWLGRLILQRPAGDLPAHPIGEAALGTVLLLVVFLIPGVNVLALFVFAVWGSGGLTYAMYRGLRPPRPTTIAPVAPPTGTVPSI